jgi:hypothetical protein
MATTYVPLTPEEVAFALSLADEADNGVYIAWEMMNGLTEFTHDELELLADLREITVDELIESDPRFESYADPVEKTKKRIAKKLLALGKDAEFAAELCGLTLEKVKKLHTDNCTI